MDAFRTINWLFGCVLGGILIYSGVVHLSQPMAFAASIAAYQLVSTPMISILTFLLPSVQIVVGFGLVFASNRIGFVWLAAVLFTVFAVSQISVILDGRQISCGCFGLSSEPIGLATLTPPLLGVAWSISKLLGNYNRSTPDPLKAEPHQDGRSHD